MAGSPKKRGSTRRVAEGIYARNGHYVVPIYDASTGKKKWHSGFESLADAKEFKREEERRKRLGKRGIGPETVASFAERWPRDHPRPERTTNMHNAERVKAFVRDFGDRMLADVTRQEARAWAMGGQVPENMRETAKGWFGAEAKPNGQVVVPAHRGNVAPVRAMFNDAIRDELIEQNPFGNMRLPQSRGRKDLIVLSEAELDRLTAIAHQVHGPEYGPLFAAFIQVAAWTGMRPGELYALRWSDVDYSRGEIHVRSAYKSKTKETGLPKNHERRTIVLLAAAEVALRGIPRRATAGPGEADPDVIFVTKRGKPYSGRTHHFYWDPVRTAFWAQLPPERQAEVSRQMDFYELRHYCATRLLERGLWASDVAEQLGHRDNGKLVMDTYGHPSRDAARERIRAADRPGLLREGSHRARLPA